MEAKHVFATLVRKRTHMVTTNNLSFKSHVLTLARTANFGHAKGCERTCSAPQALCNQGAKMNFHASDSK